MLHTLLALALSIASPLSQTEPANDLLGEVEVEAGGSPRTDEAPLIVLVLNVEGPPRQAMEVRRHLERDLQLFGRFALRNPHEVDGARTAHVVVAAENEAWSLVATISDAEVPVRVSAPTTDTLRPASHRLADALIGTLTGTPGPFHSTIGFVATAPGTRRAQLADSDGSRVRWLSPGEDLASTVAFDRRGQPWYAASRQRGRFQLRTADHVAPAIDPQGSVYGVSFAPHKDAVAVALAAGSGIELWIGLPDRLRLARRPSHAMALQPDFGPRGELAYVGHRGRERRRVYVGDRAISDPKRDASSPSFCAHPKGTRLVWVERRGKQSKLVVAAPDGSDRRELDAPGPEVGATACSPDGRLVAFFVTRPKGKAGLWVANLDRWRPQQLADVRGDQLKWSPRMP